MEAVGPAPDEYPGAVATVTRSRRVAAPPEAVWDILADFGALSAWAPNVDHSCILESGATPIGTTRRVQIGRNTLVERITESDPPAVLAYDIEGLPPRLGRVANRWTVAGGDEASTVELTSTVSIGEGPISRLTEGAVCRMVARQSDAMLAGLAARLEESP